VPRASVKTVEIPRDEVGALSRGERAAVAEAERARRVDGHPAQRFLGREPEQRARHAQHQQRRERRRRAGVVVGGDGDRHAGGAQGSDRRQLRLAQEVEGAG
jgi:hypothetical protein